MFRIILFLIVLFPCVALGQDPPVDGATTQSIGDTQRNSPLNESEVSALIESLTTAVDYLSRNAAAQNYGSDYDRESVGLQGRDLDAQENMASSTKIMAIVAVPALLLTIIGVYMLGRTLAYTREAADHTRKTLGVAQKTLTESRKVTKAAQRTAIAAEDTVKQNRAWMCVNTDTTLTPFLNEKGIRVEIRIENGGGTPALRVKTASDIKRDLSEESALSIQKHILDASNECTVGAGQADNLEFPLSALELDEIAAGKTNRSIYIVCKYDTTYVETFLMKAFYEINVTKSATPKQTRYSIFLKQAGSRKVNCITDITPKKQ